MKAPSTFQFPPPPSDAKELTQWSKDLVDAITQHLQAITDLINGNLTLGDAVTHDNLAGQYVEVTTAGAGVEATVNHDLGQVPVGFILIIPPASGSVNKGPTSWTASSVYLTCSAATQTFTIFLLAQPLR